MPIFNIGSGNPYKLPVLDGAYPVDVTQLQQADGSATFEVKITTAGIPDEYTYQWYVDGVAVAGETSSTYTRNGLSSASTHTVYCVVTSKAGSVQSRTAVLTVKGLKPEYTYSGTASLVDDGSGNYRLKFLTSGNLKFTSLGSIADGAEVFLVGGGGGGAKAGGGGGGGYVTNASLNIENGVEYVITVGGGGSAGEANKTGSAGGTTSIAKDGAVLVKADGGKGGSGSSRNGGAGGSGGGGYQHHGAKAGNGGSNGSNGGNAANYGSGAEYIGAGGSGSGKTTYEFGDSKLTLYAGGGGGGVRNGSSSNRGLGGSGGGGNGGYNGSNKGANGTTNTGGGGGGGGYDDGNGYSVAGTGGSGIVIIRNKR